MPALRPHRYPSTSPARLGCCSRGARPGPGTKGNCSPARVGPGLLRGPCSPGLRTAAEIKRQKTRRQEGVACDAIFLLRGHRQSPRRRRGASFRAPRGPRARASGCRGPRLLPDTPPPPGLWRRTFWSSPRVTFHHAGPQLLRPPFSALALGTLGCSSRDRRPALPGRHLNNSERCTWFFSAGLLFPFSWNNNN